MIYFFSKRGEYLQCEIHAGKPHVLTLISPNGVSNFERYAASDDLTNRWEQLTDAMEADGWMGPFGRDPRS